MKKKSIGYVTGHHFGGWIIPQKFKQQYYILTQLTKNLIYLIWLQNIKFKKK